jgi:hypothetical protein
VESVSRPAGSFRIQWYRARADTHDSVVRIATRRERYHAYAHVGAHGAPDTYSYRAANANCRATGRKRM